MVAPIILDGPVGTELCRRGVPTPLPLWSADAIESHPRELGRIHADYAEAGATVHTANTFRTDPWTLERLGLGQRWRRLTRDAVRLARGAVPEGHRIAGSLSPLEDCYRRDLSPTTATCRREHGRFADQLAEAGVDLLLCETFPHPAEAIAASRAALATGLPVWLALTQGPSGDLMADDELLATMQVAAGLGVEAVLVNCNPVPTILPLLRRVARLGIPFGAYGNVGRPDADVGWRNEGDARPEPYARAVRGWLELGAGIVGGCCGTTPAHIAAIVASI
jgi:S-methylmethionine-dependent homocysteine/selenocysteine methylase